ncbi:MAG: CSLREA domain-containing protein [Anaerolineae bacterium]|nr:CSLREA domain-containing protein [Anaerolineae bacterium]NUQ03771.1 CSLREA domain-containing protein [Anaerolineae bacterium]
MRPALFLVLVVVFGVMLQVTPVFAASIVVDSAADGAPAVDGDCTLREAIENANDDAATNADCAAGSGADIITFSVGGPITLTSGDQLVILDADPDTLTITGPMTIIGSGSRVFLVGNDTTNDAVARTLILNGVIVQSGDGTGLSGGSASENGGCVLVRPNSTLDMNGATVEDCYSTANGGGIYADEDSTVTVNSASIIDGNTAEGNGGGISMSTGTIVVDGDSCIQNNTAYGVGGGIEAGDTVTITFGGGSVSNRAFLVNNTASNGGGIYMAVNSTFDGSHGRFFVNSATLGSAWFSQGGSGANGESAIGRRCVNCCIVGNTGNQAVRQTVDGLDANFVNNWWGSNFGPYISSAGAGTGNGTSSGDGISGNGISAVDVGITSIPADYGTESTGSDSNWLTTTGGDVPSDCINDYCTPVSAVNHGTGRSCFYVKLS